MHATVRTSVIDEGGVARGEQNEGVRTEAAMVEHRVHCSQIIRTNTRAVVHAARRAVLVKQFAGVIFVDGERGHCARVAAVNGEKIVGARTVGVHLRLRVRRRSISRQSPQTNGKQALQEKYLSKTRRAKGPGASVVGAATAARALVDTHRRHRSNTDDIRGTGVVVVARFVNQRSNRGLTSVIRIHSRRWVISSITHKLLASCKVGSGVSE
jgi:hypothetical protein